MQASTQWTKELETLTDGYIFAGRYAIVEKRPRRQPHCRLATDKITRNEVFLKFYPRGSLNYKNAVKLHRSFKSDCRHVCRMIDHLDGACGFPPCLVMEKGSFSLAERLAGGLPSSIEQKSLIYSVLEALEYLHRQGIVHGCVNPTHLMWFCTDFSWKVISLGHTGREEEFSLISHTLGRYDAPELAEMMLRGSTHISLERSMDMWSFGILAFEIFTHASIWHVSCVLDYMKRHLAVSHFAMGGSSRRWIFHSWMGRSQYGEKQQALRFVQLFLNSNPNDRETATQALSHAIFLPGGNADGRDDTHRFHLSHFVSVTQAFQVSIAIGRRGYSFMDANPEHAIQRSGGHRLRHLSPALNMLPPEQRTNDCYLLQFRIAPSLNSPCRIQVVQGIRIEVIGRRSVNLEFRQSRMGPVVDVLAWIPSSGDPNVMQEIGMVQDHRRCIEIRLALRICLEVNFDGQLIQQIDLFREIHCSMNRDTKVLESCYIVGCVKKIWKCFPQVVRDFVRRPPTTISLPRCPSRSST